MVAELLCTTTIAAVTAQTPAHSQLLPTTGGMLPQAVRSQLRLPQLPFGSLMGQVDGPKPMPC